MRKIVVVGNSGYIGKYLYDNLRFQDCIVEGYNSSTMNLHEIPEIQKVLEDNVDYLIYCAIEKGVSDLVETNLNNLKNLLKYKNHILNFIHCSSRAVYTGLGGYENIPVIPIQNLPSPTDDAYSQLKYQEELELLKCTNPVYCLRLFDVSDDDVHSNIIDRWKKQIEKHGICRNEILSPIRKSSILSFIKDIISNKVDVGTYNLCENKQIYSFQELSRIGYSISGKSVVINKTGQSSL